jgi:hypothetical protein
LFPSVARCARGEGREGGCVWWTWRKKRRRWERGPRLLIHRCPAVMVVGTLCLEVWWSMELNEAREGWKKEGGRRLILRTSTRFALLHHGCLLLLLLLRQLLLLLVLLLLLPVLV